MNRIRGLFSSFAAALLFCAFLLTGRQATAAIVFNWDDASQATGQAPTAPGVAYSLGNGWTAMASSEYQTQGTYYQVTAASSVGFAVAAESSPNIVITAHGTGSPGRDANTTSMIVLSPVFTLDGSGNPITVALMGGANGTTAPTNISGIGSTITADGNGWQGVAIIDADGNVLETAQRPGGSDYHYAVASLDTSSLDDNTPYQLALIDTFSGGYGWVGMDDVTLPGNLVTVPEPSSIGLLGMGLAAVVLRRKRK